MYCLYCLWPYTALRPMQLGHSYAITCMNCGGVIKLAVTEISPPTVTGKKLAELRGVGTDRSYEYDKHGKKILLTGEYVEPDNTPVIGDDNDRR